MAGDTDETRRKRQGISLETRLRMSAFIISAQRIVVSRIPLASASEERLELSTDYLVSTPGRGFVMADWHELNLARLQGDAWKGCGFRRHDRRLESRIA